MKLPEPVKRVTTCASCEQGKQGCRNHYSINCRHCQTIWLPFEYNHLPADGYAVTCARNALQVISLNPTIQKFLQEKDPMALRQVEEAIQGLIQRTNTCI